MLLSADIELKTKRQLRKVLRYRTLIGVMVSAPRKTPATVLERWRQTGPVSKLAIFENAIVKTSHH